MLTRRKPSAASGRNAHGGRSSAVSSPRRRGMALVGALALGSTLFSSVPASASSVSSAVFTGAAGTVSVGGVLFAKQGAAVTLTVTTSSDTKCVEVTGAAALPRQTSSTARTSWTFATTAPAGNGAQAFTVAASPNFNANNCTGQTNSTQASYTVDNTGPVVAASLTPTPNAAGWNNSNVSIAWSATDSGVGMTGGQAAQPTPATDSVTANTTASGVTRTATGARDALGNAQSAAGSVTVRLDKTAPSITAAQTANADGTTTITFTCNDAPSGIESCLAGGSTTNSRTVNPGQTVVGTATDKAGNTATASSTAPAGDLTAPTLSGAPTTAPNGTNGWYTSDVTIRWTAADPQSGIPTPPADTTITGEGTGLTSTKTVTNGAGLSTTATSSPAVKIDRTAPVTGISGTSNAWVNGTVDVTLAPDDNLSGVASTSFSIDGGAAQSGTTFSLSTEGEHTVVFFSTDAAGNAEVAKTVQVKIDKTAPSIGHAFTAPSGYTNGGWTNQDVTVAFTCTDQGGSGLASCTEPVTTSGEGAGQQVVGTGTDNAGNTATDTALVSIDKTDPEVSASVSGTKNAAGWYKEGVTVSFSATDQEGLSGVAGTSPAQVLGQGTNQSVTGTATDAAGNTGSVTVSGINIDTTAPVLSGSFAAGWHTDDVTVSWTCTDAGGSGVNGAQPASTVVDGEGANLSATASCEDVAGNTVTETVSGIQIDRTPPTTTGAVAGSLSSGWYSAPVQVTLTGDDNLSGVAATYYTVDGGDAQTYGGAFSFGTEGQHTISFWSVDGAGLVEAAGAPLTIQIDRTAPDTQVINPISPDSGWFVTSGIPVAFLATDAGSGIAATYYKIDGGATQTYGEPFTTALSEGTHTIVYWSVDLAGNVEMKDSETFKTVTVNVDTLSPTVSPADVNNTTWRNADLSQAFTASDAGSGLADDADASFTLTASAESTKSGTTVVPTTVQKTVADKAGNTTTRTVSALIDRTSPVNVAFVGGPAEGTRYYSNLVPVPTCSASDALSGLKDCIVTGYSTAEGTHTLTATATDMAGNSATTTRTYTVRNLVRNGFFQPVDMGVNGSIVWNSIKGGNTVPLKFEVFDGSTELTSTTAVTGFSAQKVSCLAGPEDAIELFATTGQTELRYDSANGGQFIQNWKTPTGSGCYKVTVTTVDGQPLTAYFKTLK